jgi:copper resistance protein B
MALSRIASWSTVIALAAAPAIARAESPLSGEVDLLEFRVGGGPDHIAMESTFTLGRDPDHLVVKVDGSDGNPVFDSLQVQALYARKIGGSVSVLVGGRHDFRSAGDLSYLSVGVEIAVTPWLEAEHYAYLSENGDLTGGGKLVANWDLATGLRLEPRVQLGWSAQDVRTEGLASGLTDLETSVRLRKELNANLDVYLGIMHKRLLGRTRALANAAHDGWASSSVVAGAGFRF